MEERKKVKGNKSIQMERKKDRWQEKERRGRGWIKETGMKSEGMEKRSEESCFENAEETEA